MSYINEKSSDFTKSVLRTIYLTPVNLHDIAALLIDSFFLSNAV